MRRVFAVLFCIIMPPVSAHSDECLEHHWVQPEYASELRLQLMLMAGIMAVMLAYNIIRLFWRRDRCG